MDTPKYLECLCLILVWKLKTKRLWYANDTWGIWLLPKLRERRKGTSQISFALSVSFSHQSLVASAVSHNSSCLSLMINRASLSPPLSWSNNRAICKVKTDKCFYFWRLSSTIAKKKKSILSLVDMNIYFLSQKLALDFPKYSFINYLIIVSVLIVS